MNDRRIVLAILVFAASSLAAQTRDPRGPAAIDVRRAAARVTVDGNVTPEEWAGAQRIERFFEFNPGDNVEPKVHTTAYILYDDRFLYAGFVMDDPEPSAIRAPYSDRDDISDKTDYAGLLLSCAGDGKTAVEFLATPRGVQYDAIQTDAAGEDSAPDFYWDSVGRITDRGWMLEIRVPFSSLRYTPGKEDAWSVIVYRNYPRDRRYQIGSAPFPRGANCFACNFTPITGLSSLPSASHLTIAPYTTVTQSGTTEEIGVPLTTADPDAEVGVDAKWNPNANVAIDATVNPDFSQVESDAAVITANERFAIFLPEKRPFFLEGKDIFTTPVQAVYTRTVNSPRWGLRSTGNIRSTAYTALVVDDRGGGQVLIPGANNSHFASQDFESLNFIGRARHDIGRSFASFLVTDREIDEGGYNRVFGPDGYWQISGSDNIRGQLLISDSETPVRPDLDEEWTGQSLTSYAGQLEWSHSTRTNDAFLVLIDRGDDFRADLGFVPQVGVREAFGETGYTWRPTGFFSRVRTFVEADYTGAQNGDLVYRFVNPGIGFDGRWTSFGRFSYSMDRIRAGAQTIPREQFHYELAIAPSRMFQNIEVEGRFGSDIDFANSRPGDGAQLEVSASVQATDHLQLSFGSDYRYLDVLEGQRLFTARVARIKATYNFNARSFLRLIGDYARTDRDPDLYDDDVSEHDAQKAFSALYAYKLNWQTVLYVGYGDARELIDGTSSDYAPSNRQAFVKMSYAWQR